MESWSYTAEEKGYFFSDEMDFPLEAFMRSRKALAEWDSKGSSNYEKDGFSDREVVKSMEFVDLGYPDLFQKSFHGSEAPETANCELNSNYSRKFNPCAHVSALDSSLVKEDSESKHSSSLVDSKSHESSLIDLKLGRLADCKDESSDKTAKVGLTLCSTQQTVLAKRAHTSSSAAQTPVCQVYGCNMDLSSSKDYHRRHKVCDAHSKTAKVIVNGIEQRFCQQCSRFHLLAEFDDGKRSCRRRLAGHNERRRKPQYDYISGKRHKMLQSYQGTKNPRTSLQKRSQFAFQDIFEGGIFHSGKYEQTSQSEHIKLEDCCAQLAVPITHGQDLSRASNSSCALSLLSAQSQDLSCHSAGNPVASSLIFQGSSGHHNNNQITEIPLGVRSMDEYLKNKSFLSGMNSPEVFHSGASHALECGATVDLFQLSSHLRRVEQQRNSLQVKQENLNRCCFPTV